MKVHAFETVCKEFAGDVKQGDIIVAGEIYLASPITAAKVALNGAFV